MAEEYQYSDIVKMLRDRACPAGEPWTGDNPEEDHGHTDCWLMHQAAGEIERLRDWQRQAEEVLERWDAVYEMVPHPTESLGAYQSDVVATEIERLRGLITEWADAEVADGFHDEPECGCGAPLCVASAALRKAVGR